MLPEIVDLTDDDIVEDHVGIKGETAEKPSEHSIREVIHPEANSESEIGTMQQVCNNK